MMKKLMTTDEAAEKWNLSKRRVQILCGENRIEGAQKINGVWMIPTITEKPKELKPGKKKENIKNNIRLMSLFSGCGGLDLGFEGGFDTLKRSINQSIHPGWIQNISEDGNWVTLKKNQFTTVFGNDIFEDARKLWVRYFSSHYNKSGSIYYLDSIVDLVKMEKNNGVDIFPDNIDIVTGGFPCQDFSVAGKRKGFESDKSHTGDQRVNEPSEESRGKLYIWMREVINLVKPKMFIAENVKGLTNLSDAKEIIESDFQEAADGGYIVIPAKVILAADYGVPQSRERVFFFGFKRSALREEALAALQQNPIPPEYDPYPVKTHSKGGMNGLHPYVTVDECFVNLEEPDQSADPSQKAYSKAKYLGKRLQGQIEVDLNDIGPTIRSEHHGNIEYRRLSREHGGNHENELENGLSERRLSVRECARIQTFPDDYDFVVSKSMGGETVSASMAYKAIGNAVPPVLAYNIARSLQDKWNIYFK